VIVDPDFLDHWRTRMVVDALDGDEMAPLCILRLWGHCQSRKSDRFEMPTAGLKAQCRYKGDAAAFEQALVDAGFVSREGVFVVVLGWAEQNASLIAAWENGAKGGRPPKQKPTGNPAVTQGEPGANPDETDKRGGEGIREPSSPSLRSGERGTRLPKDWSLPESWMVWAIEERNDLDILKTAEKFKDHWVAKAGKAGVKLDWEATWRNWVRDERRPFVPRQQSPPQSFRQQDQDAAAAQMAAFGSLVAAKPSRPMEVIDVTARRLDRQDLLEDGADLRGSLAANVGRP
jgi:hypothetical protein